MILISESHVHFHKVTLQCAHLVKRLLASSSGTLDSGRRIWEISHITFQHFTLWTLKYSVGNAWAIRFDNYTSSFPPTRIVLRIWIKISRTLLSIKSLFTHYHKNGYGAKAGAQTKRKQARKRSTFAITRCTRNPKCLWRSESLAESYSTRVGSSSMLWLRHMTMST